mmetsp:Transcript_46909/g.101921  ORF Transcript_46909/g.101921 Transcript_46909/m.101921 type:complete len:397 (+) Transcript_46909:77-1267(+)
MGERVGRRWTRSAGGENPLASVYQNGCEDRSRRLVIPRRLLAGAKDSAVTEEIVLEWLTVEFQQEVTQVFVQAFRASQWHLLPFDKCKAESSFVDGIVLVICCCGEALDSDIVLPLGQLRTIPERPKLAELYRDLKETERINAEKAFKRKERKEERDRRKGAELEEQAASMVPRAKARALTLPEKLEAVEEVFLGPAQEIKVEEIPETLVEKLVLCTLYLGHVELLKDIPSPDGLVLSWEVCGLTILTQPSFLVVGIRQLISFCAFVVFDAAAGQPDHVARLSLASPDCPDSLCAAEINVSRLNVEESLVAISVPLRPESGSLGVGDTVAEAEVIIASRERQLGAAPWTGLPHFVDPLRDKQAWQMYNCIRDQEELKAIDHVRSHSHLLSDEEESS